MKPPKYFFIIIDPLDGPHLFKSMEKAKAKMKKWEKGAQDSIHDSYWDMKGPYCYRLEKEASHEE